MEKKLKLYQKNILDLKSSDFIKAWQALFDSCKWATPFQSPGFVITWYGIYGEKYSPIILSLESKIKIFGLLFLSKANENQQIVVAGAHQAVYQCWLQTDDCPENFFYLSMKYLQKKKYRVNTLFFKFLPEKFPKELITKSKEIAKICRLVEHPRPLIELRSDEIKKSLKKKANKGRIRQLERIGKLKFYRITDFEDFVTVLDEIIPYYDFRQGAIHNTFPFLEDIYKRQFHCEMVRDYPELFHITVVKLNETILSIYFGLQSRDRVHLAIIAHSPEYSKYSPGKLHLLQLLTFLENEQKKLLDLTPGGDAWKERYANKHDMVYEIVFYKNQLSKLLNEKIAFIYRKTKKILLINTVLKINKIKFKSIIYSIQKFFPTIKKIEILRFEVSAHSKSSMCNSLCINNLTDIIKLGSKGKGSDLQSFCMSALRRIENGEKCYTFSLNEILIHCGWIADDKKEMNIAELKLNYHFPPDSLVFYDFFTDFSQKYHQIYQESLKSILVKSISSGNVKYIYAFINERNTQSLSVLEKIGFVPIESMYCLNLIGIVKKRLKKYQ